MSAYVLSKKNSTVYHLEVDSVNFQTDLEVSGDSAPCTVMLPLPRHWHLMNEDNNPGQIFSVIDQAFVNDFFFFA